MDFNGRADGTLESGERSRSQNEVGRGSRGHHRLLRDNYLCERIASRKNLTLRGEDASWEILLYRVFAKPLTHGIWVIDSRNILLFEPPALQA